MPTQAGEARIQRREEIANALSTKVARTKNPWLNLRVNYGSLKGKLYNEEEDRFLVCMTNQLGYGEWEALREEVRKCWLFRFDWFLRTRTTTELQRRVDTLIRVIERENEEVAAAEAAAAKERKKSAQAAKVMRGGPVLRGRSN